MLADASTVSKTSQRVQAYGAVDELNSFLGLLRSNLLSGAMSSDPVQQQAEAALAEALLARQQELFALGSLLANFRVQAEGGRSLQGPKVQDFEQYILVLEQHMDAMSAEVPPLKHFILPGGHPLAATAHVARSVCRRAERDILLLHEKEEVPAPLRIYMNRLSDWCFLLARFLSKIKAALEILWQG